MQTKRALGLSSSCSGCKDKGELLKFREEESGTGWKRDFKAELESLN